MATITPVNIWTNPNDWTGDSIRESFNKVNTNIDNLNADTLDDIPVWATNKHITQTQLNKIEAWVMLTDADCDTVTTWGRYWMIWTPVNWPQAWEFYLEVLSDWTRIMQIATYLDNTVWTRYYNWTVWSTWIFWKATWTNTWDQTSIVWITWTKAQFNTAVTDWAIVYEWDDITWNAWTATALQTARTINWVSFNWTANISVPSDIAPWTSWNVLTSNWTTWESQAPTWWGSFATIVWLSNWNASTPGSDITNFIVDIDANNDVTSGVFTAPNTGIYHIALYWRISITVASTASIDLKLNITTYALQIFATLEASDNASVSAERMITMSAGSTLRIRYQGANATVSQVWMTIRQVQ